MSMLDRAATFAWCQSVLAKSTTSSRTRQVPEGFSNDGKSAGANRNHNDSDLRTLQDRTQ